MEGLLGGRSDWGALCWGIRGERKAGVSPWGSVPGGPREARPQGMAAAGRHLRSRCGAGGRGMGGGGHGDTRAAPNPPHPGTHRRLRAPLPPGRAAPPPAPRSGPGSDRRGSSAAAAAASRPRTPAAIRRGPAQRSGAENGAQSKNVRSPAAPRPGRGSWRRPRKGRDGSGGGGGNGRAAELRSCGASMGGAATGGGEAKTRWGTSAVGTRGHQRGDRSRGMRSGARRLPPQTKRRSASAPSNGESEAGPSRRRCRWDPRVSPRATSEQRPAVGAGGAEERPSGAGAAGSEPRLSSALLRSGVRAGGSARSSQLPAVTAHGARGSREPCEGLGGRGGNVLKRVQKWYVYKHSEFYFN